MEKTVGEKKSKKEIFFDFFQKVLAEKKYLIIILTAIIAIQVLMIVLIGLGKQSLHIDEIYSFILSNSANADRISNDSSVWDIWFSGQQFNKYLVVDKGEQFSYGSVYYNNSLDSHPPLYYFMLHTVCSFFPGMFSMWFGIALNIIFFIVTQVFLYLLSARLFKNKFIALLPVLLYGFSATAVDTTIFIRMYAMITMFTVISLYLHVKLLQDGLNYYTIGWIGLVTFLGVMTQYFFIFLTVAVALSYFIYGLVKKQYLHTLVYCLTMIAAVGLMLLLWPTALSQMFGSATNNVGNSVSSNLFNFSLWFSNIKTLIYEIIFNYFAGVIALFYLTIAVIVIGVGLAIFFLVRRKKKCGKMLPPKSDVIERTICYKNIKFVCVALAVILVNFLLVSKLCGEFAYIRYLYNAFPVMIVAVLMLVCFTFSKVSLMQLGCLCLAALSLVNGIGVWANNTCRYLHQRENQTLEAVLETHGDVPLLIIGKQTAYIPTSGCLTIQRYSKVYMSSDGDVDDIKTILSQVDTSNGILCYIWTEQYWSKGEGYDLEEKKNEIIQKASANGVTLTFTETDETTQSLLAWGTTYYVTVS